VFYAKDDNKFRRVRRISVGRYLLLAQSPDFPAIGKEKKFLASVEY
jgi:hypothetical protein